MRAEDRRAWYVQDAHRRQWSQRIWARRWTMEPRQRCGAFPQGRQQRTQPTETATACGGQLNHQEPCERRPFQQKACCRRRTEARRRRSRSETPTPADLGAGPELYPPRAPKEPRPKANALCLSSSNSRVSLRLRHRRPDPATDAAERQASAGARNGVKGKRRTLAARAPLHALVGLPTVKRAAPSVRVRPFFGLGCISVHSLRDYSLGKLIEVFSQRAMKLFEFRPQRLINKAFRDHHHYGCVSLTTVPVGPESVSAQESGHQSPGPLIAQREAVLDRWLIALDLVKPGADSFASVFRRHTLALGSRAGKQSLYEAKFLDQPVFFSHFGERILEVRVAAQRQASAGARDGVKGKGRTLGARAPLHALVRLPFCDVPLALAAKYKRIGLQPTTPGFECDRAGE